MVADQLNIFKYVYRLSGDRLNKQLLGVARKKSFFESRIKRFVELQIKYEIHLSPSNWISSFSCKEHRYVFLQKEYMMMMICNIFYPAEQYDCYWNLYFLMAYKPKNKVKSADVHSATVSITFWRPLGIYWNVISSWGAFCFFSCVPFKADFVFKPLHFS